MLQTDRRRSRRLAVAAALSLVLAAAAPPASERAWPVARADVDWLRLPDGLAMGEVASVAVGADDSIWVLHRPATVAEGAKAAPPILHFHTDGRFLGGFGGAGTGYDWPTTEHSLAVDGRGHVWVAGSYRQDAARADDMVVELDGSGGFVRQIGGRGTSRGDLDTGSLHAPGDLFVDDRARELYVADGYGNRRLIVFDRDTGAFKRMWSAFGAAPPDTPAPALRQPGQPFAPDTGEGPSGFNGVHGVEVSRDGLVYVSDRNNQRIQIFTRTGRYLRQLFVDRNLPSPQSTSGLAFSADRQQRYLYVADWGNSRLLVYDRARLRLLGTVGAAGAGNAPEQFRGPHLIAVDSRGTLYVAEVQGRRLQRLQFVASR